MFYELMCQLLSQFGHVNTRTYVIIKQISICPNEIELPLLGIFKSGDEGAFPRA
jgi:hypothetical protein